jgi:hypothetical protein
MVAKVQSEVLRKIFGPPVRPVHPLVAICGYVEISVFLRERKRHTL